MILWTWDDCVKQAETPNVGIKDKKNKYGLVSRSSPFIHINQNYKNARPDHRL